MTADPGGPHPLQIPGLDFPLALFTHRDEDRFISRAIVEKGIWEPFETELIARSLRPGDTFLDVGANIGYFTLLAAALVGASGAVYAFEPEPRNYALLRDNILLNGLGTVARAFPLALADSAGATRLYISEDNLGDHQLQPGDSDRDSVRVDTATGAGVLAGRTDRADFVKIDTQGSESRVVDGLMPVLQASGEGLRLLVELTPRSLRLAGSSGEALLLKLAALGLPFHIVDHIEHRLVPTSLAALVTWCRNVDAVAEDEGFMNILVGESV